MSVHYWSENRPMYKMLRIHASFQVQLEAAYQGVRPPVVFADVEWDGEVPHSEEKTTTIWQTWRGFAYLFT